MGQISNSLMRAPARNDTVTKLVEKRGTRRVDGVEGSTTLSDAVDARNQHRVASTYAESAPRAFVRSSRFSTAASISSCPVKNTKMSPGG